MSMPYVFLRFYSSNQERQPLLARAIKIYKMVGENNCSYSLDILVNNTFNVIGNASNDFPSLRVMNGLFTVYPL